MVLHETDVKDASVCFIAFEMMDERLKEWLDDVSGRSLQGIFYLVDCILSRKNFHWKWFEDIWKNILSTVLAFSCSFLIKFPLFISISIQPRTFWQVKFNQFLWRQRRFTFEGILWKFHTYICFISTLICLFWIESRISYVKTKEQI